jgi:hypothetical protein
VAQAGSGATLKMVLRLAHGIEDRAKQNELLETIAKAQAAGGELAAALATAEGIADAAARIRALIGIAKEQYEVDRDAGQSTMERAIQFVQELEDMQTRAEVLADAAQTQAELGELSAALMTAQEILSIAHQLDNSEEEAWEWASQTL